MCRTRKIFTVGTSKLNRLQVRAALDILSDFVKSCGVSPARLVKHGYPELGETGEIQAADSFHGREGSISVVITGTKKGSAPRFVSNENRLNVMLTRQKSGLLIAGDKDAAGVIEGTKKELRHVDKQAAKGLVFYEAIGEQVISKAKALRGMLVQLHEMGRIFEIDADKEKEDAAGESQEQKLAEEEKALAQEDEAREKTARLLEYLSKNWEYGEVKVDKEDEDLEDF